MPSRRKVILILVVVSLYISVREYISETLYSKNTSELIDQRSDDELHDVKDRAVAEERYLDAERVRVILRKRREARLRAPKISLPTFKSSTQLHTYLIQFTGRRYAVKLKSSSKSFDDFVSLLQSHRACNNDTILSMSYELLTSSERDSFPLTASNFGIVPPQDILVTVKLEEICVGHQNVELEGDVVKWGSDNLLPTVEDCCEQCRSYEATDGSQCNAWVYCADEKKCTKLGTYQQCWLKYQSDPENTPLRGSGPGNPWTSGKTTRSKQRYNPQQDTSSFTCRDVSYLPSETKPPSFLSRSCGSPAINAYLNISNKCLVESNTNKAYSEYMKSNSASTMICYREQHASYDGITVLWGIGNKKSSSEECALSCVRYKPRADGGVGSNLPCNSWVYCPVDSPVCFEPDAHTHTAGDCWLRFTEHPQLPEVNMRGVQSAAFRKRHPSSPEITPWISGVVLLPNTPISSGVWGPRSNW